MQRRDFIKGTCRVCLLGGTSAAFLASCSAATGKAVQRPEVKNGRVEVALSSFEKESFIIISPAKFDYEISVEKTQDNTYKALLLKCTHYQNQLTPTGNGFTCTAHGSKFNKEGAVINGPAAAPLQHLKTEIFNNSLLIQLK